MARARAESGPRVIGGGLRGVTMGLYGIADAWRSAVADSTGGAFERMVTPNVSLTGSAFSRRVVGRPSVWIALSASASIYDSVDFRETAEANGFAYLQWSGIALGLDISGVTVLERSADRRISAVSIHLRPFTAVVAFAGELGLRLAGSVDVSGLNSP